MEDLEAGSPGPGVGLTLGRDLGSFRPSARLFLWFGLFLIIQDGFAAPAITSQLGSPTNVAVYPSLAKT